jgi:hypothetical protein
MSGVVRKKRKYTREEMDELLRSTNLVSSLRVAHGLPYGMGPGVRHPYII